MNRTYPRFMKYVDKNGPVPEHMPHLGQCWVWTGCASDGGYGQFTIKFPKTRGAHRVSFALHLGVDPIGDDVLHHCDNRLCVNPSHLWLGDDTDNVADRIAKDRGARGANARGAAKLNESQVAEIKRLKHSHPNWRSKAVQEQVGRPFGVGHFAVYEIWKGISWKEVAPAEDPGEQL